MACSSGSVGCGTMCSPKGSARSISTQARYVGASTEFSFCRSSLPETRLLKSRGRRERSTRKRSGTSVARRRALCNSHLVSPL